MSNDNVPDDLECHGWLYEVRLTQCRSQCQYRDSCRSLLKKRLDAMGKERFLAAKIRVLDENEIDMRREENEKESIDPQVSPQVAEVLAAAKSLGLVSVQRIGHIALKLNKRNLFCIFKMKSRTITNIVKLMYTKTREEVPNDLLPYVSEEKLSGAYCLNVDTLDALTDAMRGYIHFVQGKGSL